MSPVGQCTKPKKCKAKGCGKSFMPRSTLQTACSPKCALALSRRAEKIKVEKEAKERRKKTRQQLEDMKTVRELTKEAQKEFNAWIRERDYLLPCISCDTFPSGHGARGGLWDCGHYRSTGANPELRFEPLNAHKQCKQCNQYLSGNVVNYRIHLERRIGSEKLEWLEGSHEAKNYTRDQLREIRDSYRAKARKLCKVRQNCVTQEVLQT